MISKIVKLLLICIVCSAVLSATMTPTILYEYKTMKETIASDSADPVHPTLTLIGDPVPGGGTPIAGNQAGNQTV